jgi:hypothetical protein
MSGRRQRIAVKIGAWLVLLFALSPNVLFIGHWSPGAQVETHSHEAQTTAAHAEHCHGDARQCDAPAMVSVSWVTGESTPAQFPESALRPVHFPAPAAAPDTTISVITPPPRTLAATAA